MMELMETSITGVMVAKTSRIGDRRGTFARFFCETELANALGQRHIVQINHSRTINVGAVRGMHYQHPPCAEMKLVRCIKGRVWDVALDLRKGSPTFLHWYGVELSAESDEMMVIPEGCAHGFQVLEDKSELLYLHTASYASVYEGGVRHNDPLVDIQWPLAVTDLSDRDRMHPLIDQCFCGVTI